MGSRPLSARSGGGAEARDRVESIPARAIPPGFVAVARRPTGRWPLLSISATPVCTLMESGGWLVVRARGKGREAGRSLAVLTMSDFRSRIAGAVMSVRSATRARGWRACVSGGGRAGGPDDAQRGLLPFPPVGEDDGRRRRRRGRIRDASAPRMRREGRREPPSSSRHACLGAPGVPCAYLLKRRTWSANSRHVLGPPASTSR